MELTVKILIIAMLFTACKKNYQGYRIQNSSGSTMYLQMADGNYILSKAETIRITSTGSIKKENISFEDVDLKPILVSLGTHPDKSYNILAYRHHFEVYVFGNADSVEIRINGKYFKEKVPFYYGDNSTNNYYIHSRPVNAQGHTYTYVFFDGIKEERFGHCDNEVGILTNKQ